MADSLTPERRSANMSRIRSVNSKPEMVVRQMAHAMGFRFRLHRRDLPGKPDVVFPSRRKAIFVHGCFWHQHPDCREGRVPGSNQGYWVPKLGRNVERDRSEQAALASAGWELMVVWECETIDRKSLAARLQDFLSG